MTCIAVNINDKIVAFVKIMVFMVFLFEICANTIIKFYSE